MKFISSMAPKKKGKAIILIVILIMALYSFWQIYLYQKKQILYNIKSITVYINRDKSTKKKINMKAFRELVKDMKYDTFPIHKDEYEGRSSIKRR